MFLNRQIVLTAAEHLGEKPLALGGKEFYTGDTAKHLEAEIKKTVDVDTVRYWLNKLVLEGVLKRRKASWGILYYSLTEQGYAQLTSSVTISQG